MGYASYLIYRDADETSKKLALGLYAAQLGLNWIWPPLFFQGRKFGLVKRHFSFNVNKKFKPNNYLYVGNN